MKKLGRHIVVDPEIRFGKPTIQGTRLTVDEVLGFLASGMRYDELDREYGLTTQQIAAVIQYAQGFLKDGHVKQIRGPKSLA